ALLKAAPYAAAHLGGEQAGHGVPGVAGDRLELRVDPLVRIADVGTARMEVTAGRPLDQARGPARDRHELLVAWTVQPRDRLEQAPGVGVLRGAEDRLSRGALDDPAAVHDRDGGG